MKRTTLSVIGGLLLASTGLFSAAAVSAKEVTVWAWDPNFNIAIMKEAGARYTAKHPDVTFKIVDMAKADLEQKLQTQLASGSTKSLPDIVLVEDYNAPKYLRSFPGAFEPMSGVVDYSGFARYKVDLMTMDGKVYGLPFDAGVTGMYYRKDLLAKAGLPRVVAIGETGLDYYGMEDRKGGRSVADLEWQRDRFRTHIRAARACAKPLIIHTRSASDDTLAILREEGEDGAGNIAGGVFHCFTESMQVARAALDLGYYLSFSGIITFKNAQDLRDVVAFTPLDRILIETDSPYLAPVPYRGKTNNPSFVPYVAQQVAQCKGIAVEEVGHATSRNFETLFKGVMP